jgi:hypothetical protein
MGKKDPGLPTFAFNWFPGALYSAPIRFESQTTIFICFDDYRWSPGRFWPGVFVATERLLIFSRTWPGTTRLVNELVLRGFPAEALKGNI